LLGAARPPLAARWPVDFAREVGLARLERFRLAWLGVVPLFAWLPFELWRRDREEVLVLDELLELRLLPERLPEDFVACAIFLAFLSLPCGHVRGRPSLNCPPLSAGSHGPTPFEKGHAFTDTSQ
jgi:hypothetical protein